MKILRASLSSRASSRRNLKGFLRPRFSQVERREKSLLVEYQVCAQDNSANFQGFWTLAAIFLGLSSAFLAGLIYAVISNEHLLSILLCQNEPWKSGFVYSVAIVVSAANIIILYKLQAWHGRIMFNQELNLRRMREIELCLGMRRWLGSRAIDNWNDILNYESDKIAATAACKQQKWDKLKKKLKEDVDGKYRCKLDKPNDEIINLIDHYFDNKKPREMHGGRGYERSSSRKHFPCILFTLQTLWALVFLSGAVIFGIWLYKLF